MKKTERLQMIVMLLKQNRRMSAKDLAESLEISLRTIYRDVDALSQMNIPIVAFEGLHGGYEIDSSYFIPTIKLCDKEILILMLLLKVSKKINLPDFKESITVLEAKLRNACHGPGKKYEGILDKITFDLQYIYTNSYLEGVFEDILKAFHENVKIQIEYFVPLKNDLSTRIISPLHLSYSEGCWYLDGFCHLRKQKRTFRLDRIRSIKVTEEEIDIDLYKKYLDKAFDEPMFLLEFEIDRDMYSLIKDDREMKNSVITGVTGNDYVIKTETNNRVYFETLAFRNITQVTIRKPDFFIEIIKEKIVKANQKYM